MIVRPKSFAAEESGGGPAEVVSVDVPDLGAAGGAKIVDRHVEETTGPKLDEAAVVVAGGRGLGQAEKFDLIEQLAKLLKGAPGASRAIVDAGWVPYSYQVGQTGKVVKPTVYIACGISGATQHMVGMKGAKNIIAINKDPEAPIFTVADLGVVGDVHKVMPKLHRSAPGPRLNHPRSRMLGTYRAQGAIRPGEREVAVIWRNWAGNQASAPVAVERPSTEEELVGIVRRAAAAGRRVKAVGTGHSFTGIACTDGDLVDLRDYGAVIAHDPDARTRHGPGGDHARRPVGGARRARPRPREHGRHRPPDDRRRHLDRRPTARAAPSAGWRPRWSGCGSSPPQVRCSTARRRRNADVLAVGQGRARRSRRRCRR